MAQIKIHAGDFQVGDGSSFSFGSFALRKPGSWFGTEVITSADIEEVAVATEDSVKRIGGTLGWGAAGAAILGPVGLLAGLLLGGRGKNVTFAVRLKDGRKFQATTDAKTFTKIQAANF